MFCPKCGQQNPETGKYCRACGTDLGNVSQALANPASVAPTSGRKRNRGGCEAAYTQIFMGAAFTIIAIILAVTGKGGSWWFWLFIPAFGMLGSGFAKLAQAKSQARNAQNQSSANQEPVLNSAPVGILQPAQTDFAPSSDSRYKTGDLVPPSVTEGTTRHLEIDKEGKTMTLPKN